MNTLSLSERDQRSMSYPETPATESQSSFICVPLDVVVAWKFDTTEGKTTIVNASVVVPMSGAESVAV